MPPNSHLRTRASIGTFFNGAVNRLEIEDTPDELLSSCLTDGSQQALVAMMDCKKRNYFHFKILQNNPTDVMGFFPSLKVAVEAVQRELHRSAVALVVRGEIVKEFWEGFCPLGGQIFVMLGLEGRDAFPVMLCCWDRI